MTTKHGQIPRGVARSVALLEARVVFLVHHDEAQPGQAGKNGQPGAQHNACVAQMSHQPVVEALRRGQATVKADDRLWPQMGKAPFHELFQLRGEVDFRDHDQDLRLFILLKDALHALQIDLGLATARGAVQQAGAGMRHQGVHGLLLFGVEAFGRVGRGRCGGWLFVMQPLQAFDEVGVSGLFEQGGQGHDGHLAW